MRLEWMEDILAVYDSGSLRAAAEIRFLTTSAFTRRIKTIEDAIGVELFDRSRKPLALKPHVVESVPRMREMVTSLRRLKRELSGSADELKRVKLICQHTLTVSWAPRIARRFSDLGTNLRIRSGNKEACLLDVLRHDVEIALVYESPDMGPGLNRELFTRELLGHERFLPVANTQDNPELSDDLSRGRVPIVSYPRNIFLGEVLEHYLAVHPTDNMSYVTVAEAGLGPAVHEFVKEGLGVGWLPSSVVAQDIEQGQLTDLSDVLPAFNLDVLAIKSASMTSAGDDKVWQLIRTGFGLRER